MPAPTLAISPVMLAIRQLARPATLRLVLIVAALTLAIFAVLGVGIYAALGAALGWMVDWLDSSPLSGTLGAFDVAFLALLITLILFWLMFRAVAMAVMGLFADSIVAAVEEDHYPDAARAAVPVPFGTGLRMGLRSALRALGWNLAAMPAYVALIITGVGTLLLVVALNAFLLRRDLEAMVAARHPGAPPLSRGQSWQLGLVSTAAFLIPFVNLLAPLFSAALAVHLFHQPAKTPASRIPDPA